MNIRELRPDDIPVLKQIYADWDFKFDFPDPDSPLTEVVTVVENSLGEAIGAGFAIRTVEMVMVLEKSHPLIRLRAIGLIHEEMRRVLRTKGYTVAFAVVSDKLRAYARHMTKKFGWKQDFMAYRIW